MKSEFRTELDLRRTIGKDVWMVLHEFVYYSELLGREVVVPANFVTDFASIPTFFHRLLPKNGEYDAAAVIHDWLYASGEVPKKYADAVFREAMEVLNVPKWRITTMFQAVDKFGWSAWNDHRNGKVPANESWKNPV